MAGMRRLAFLLFASSLVLALPACQREAPRVAGAEAASSAAAPASAAPASSAAPAVSSASVAANGTTDDSPEALMTEAFPTWKHGGVQVLRVPHQQYPDESRTVAVQPSSVMKIDATHRALVTVGGPSDEHGEDASAHADPGVVGVYLFELRDGRWFKTRAQDSVVWSGSQGLVKDIRQVELAPGHAALVVEGGFMGQGVLTTAADIVEVEPAGARLVLPVLPLHEDSFGSAAAGCEDWAGGTRTPTSEELSDPNAFACREFTGTWRIEPVADGGPGDVIVAYRLNDTVDDAQGKGKHFERTERTVVFHYTPSGYAKASGELPAF